MFQMSKIQVKRTHMVIIMRICDECAKENKIVSADYKCHSCYKDICKDHSIWLEGNPYCSDCDMDGEKNCPICELPVTMCNHRRY